MTSRVTLTRFSSAIFRAWLSPFHTTLHHKRFSITPWARRISKFHLAITACDIFISPLLFFFLLCVCACVRCFGFISFYPLQIGFPPRRLRRLEHFREWPKMRNKLVCFNINMRNRLASSNWFENNFLFHCRCSPTDANNLIKSSQFDFKFPKRLGVYNIWVSTGYTMISNGRTCH